MKYKQKYLDLKKINKYMKGGTGNVQPENATIEEVLDTSLGQYTDLKIMMSNIRSSLASMEARINNDVQTVGVRIMKVMNDKISKLNSIETILLDKFTEISINNEDLKVDVEQGNTSIMDNVEELHEKIDTLTKSLTEMELGLTKEIYELKEKLDLTNEKDDLNEMYKLKKNS